MQNSKWLRNVSTLLSLTSKIVNCLHVFQRNVFLEEKKNNLDCSCILSSLTKICLHPRYRTIIGLENLIQKDWFLAGHLFFKRMSPHRRSRTGSDEFSLQADNDTSDTISAQTGSSDPTSNGNGSRSGGGGGGEMAPTFLLFLDCIFQLTLQYPNEFEFNEFYLIKLWDYACSGLSMTFSFNGMTDWLNYLNNQKFLDNSSSNFPIDSVSVSASTTLPRGSLPKFENVYLKLLFETNNTFWLDCLSEKNNNVIDEDHNNVWPHWKNKNFFKPQTSRQLILMPIERVYMLKFWSRCYLRWHEKNHSYSGGYSDTSIKETDKTPSRLQATRPPPLPPKPKKLLKQSSTTNTATIASGELKDDFEELTSL